MATKSNRNDRIPIKASGGKQSSNVPPIIEHLKPPKLVHVIWEDISVINDGGMTWLFTETDRQYKPRLVTQVGYLIREFPEGIHICEAWGGDIMSCITQIPRGVIVTLKEL